MLEELVLFFFVKSTQNRDAYMTAMKTIPLKDKGIVFYQVTGFWHSSADDVFFHGFGGWEDSFKGSYLFISNKILDGTSPIFYVLRSTRIPILGINFGGYKILGIVGSEQNDTFPVLGVRFADSLITPLPNVKSK